MNRDRWVAVLATIVAIVGAGEAIRLKRLVGITEDGVRAPYNFAHQREQYDKLKKRYLDLQVVMEQRGLYGEIPCPDDRLDDPDVFPRLEYDHSGSIE